MATATRASTGRTSSATTQRLVHLDNLKVVLIAAIIAIHGVLGYTDTGWWSYGDAREVTLSPVSTGVLMTVVGPVGLVLIPLLFLVAGLLTAPALERKGPGRFARDRLLRLGVPFVVYVAVIQPPVVYVVDHRYGNAYGSFWQEYLGSDGQPDAGPLWFVGALLVYSLVYAGWVALRGAPSVRRRLDGRVLGLAAAAIVLPTFLVRLAWPLGSESLTDLNLWEWPACMTLFGLGIVASRQGWARQVPAAVRRQCRTATLVAAGVLLVVVGTTLLLGVDGEELLGGGHLPALGFAACEAVIAVLGAIWALGLTQRYARPYRWTAPLGRISYTAFVVQTPVLLGVAVALRPLGAPAEVKALLVAVISVAASFGLAELLRRGALRGQAALGAPRAERTRSALARGSGTCTTTRR